MPTFASSGGELLLADQGPLKRATCPQPFCLSVSSPPQIKDFDVGDLVDKKNARRYDDCLSYTMVASKKVGGWVTGGTRAPHAALARMRRPCFRNLVLAVLAVLKAARSRAALPALANSAPVMPATVSRPKARPAWAAPSAQHRPAGRPRGCAAQALQEAGLEKGANPDGHGSLDKTRVGVLVGSGMGGLTGERCGLGGRGTQHEGTGRQAYKSTGSVNGGPPAVLAILGQKAPGGPLRRTPRRMGPGTPTTPPWSPATRPTPPPPHPTAPPPPAVFQDGVKALVEKGYKKITPFFIPYAITNMGGWGWRPDAPAALGPSMRRIPTQPPYEVKEPGACCRGHQPCALVRCPSLAQCGLHMLKPRMQACTSCTCGVTAGGGSPSRFLPAGSHSPPCRRPRRPAVQAARCWPLTRASWAPTTPSPPPAPPPTTPSCRVGGRAGQGARICGRPRASGGTTRRFLTAL